MLKRLTTALVASLAFSAAALAEGEKAKPISPDHPWHFGGLTGSHDISQVQRGFQVFWARCSTCHGMEFRRFWHLENIGYTQSEVESLIREYFASQGLTYDSSRYSIINMPHSRTEGAPDLSHAVLANGKTMESGADYIYSLLIGYDRINDPLLGPAMEIEVQDQESDFVQVGETEIAYNEDGSVKSETTKFERATTYLYGEGADWVLRAFVDVRTDFQEFDADGTALPMAVTITHRLDETDPAYEAAYAADHPDYEAPETAEQAWAKRSKAHYHEIASWGAGQYFNEFKSGGILSMAPPFAALDVGHRTDFTVDELLEDASDLEFSDYWLLSNIELQAEILEDLEGVRTALADVPEGAAPRTYQPYADAYDNLQAKIDSMYPETRTALSEDVVAWLAFSSDMQLDTRKRVGFFIVLILGILSILLYFFYREVARIEFAKQAKEGGPWDENH